MSHEARKSNTVILYEHPFNERIRTYLRLEHLLHRLDQLVKRESPIDHHYALATIFEIMDVGARADLKTDVLKDLEKQKQMLLLSIEIRITVLKILNRLKRSKGLAVSF